MAQCQWPSSKLAKDEPEQSEARALRQRQASDVIEQLLARIGFGPRLLDVRGGVGLSAQGGAIDAHRR